MTLTSFGAATLLILCRVSSSDADRQQPHQSPAAFLVIALEKVPSLKVTGFLIA
jgi:hypothetical protein